MRPVPLDLTTAFLFSVIQGGIAASQTTNATKTYMEKQYEHIVSDYSAMSREWNTLTLEEQMEYTGGRFLCAKKNTKEPSLRFPSVFKPTIHFCDTGAQ